MKERRSGSFLRSLRIPETVDADEIDLLVKGELVPAPSMPPAAAESSGEEAERGDEAESDLPESPDIRRPEPDPLGT